MASLPAASYNLPRPPRRSRLAQELLGGRSDAVGLEAELLLKRLQRRGSPERPHTDDAAGAADVPLPPERGGLLHGYPRLHAGRQHAVTILLGLPIEDLPRRHRDDARADALGEQLPVSLHGQTELAPRGDEDHFGIAAGRIGEHVGATRDPCRGGVREPIERRQWLPRE